MNSVLVVETFRLTLAMDNQKDKMAEDHKSELEKINLSHESVVTDDKSELEKINHQIRLTESKVRTKI